VQNDIVTKSTDFLPGKPSLDTVSKTNKPQSKPVDESGSHTKAPRSAHVIDLKNAEQRPSDSPLLSQADKSESESSQTPMKVDAKVPTQQKSSTQSDTQIEAEEPELVEEKNLNQLNLAEQSTTPQSSEATMPKKRSKIRLLFLIIAIIIAGAIVASGILYVLTQYLP